MQRILLVEDDINIQNALREILKRNHYEVEAIPDGKAGLHLAMSGIYDLILLDIMLPKLSGLEILKKLRKSGSKTPVILLTAFDGIQHKVEGLDLGADDYLPKPFSTDELLARIRCVLRRSGEEDPLESYSFANLSLLSRGKILTANTREVSLGDCEYKLMDYFLRNQTVVLPYQSIISHVWGMDSHVSMETLARYVTFLQRKFKHLGALAEILEIRGIGYKLLERSLPS